jgi:hypothetical protein
MSGSVLERRYRWLLAWYPAALRREREEEMLAVLLAGARRGQRRPGLLESIDLIRGAIVARARLAWPGPPSRAWADGLALFTVAAPVFLLLATVLEVAVPYRMRPPARALGVAQSFGTPLQIGGLHLLSFWPFAVALACQAVIAALVLAGQRWLALAAIAGTAGCWITTIYWVPDLLQVLSASVFLLTGAALIASPGPRRGRQLLTWRHGIVLALCAAAVQVSTLMYDTASPVSGILPRTTPATTAYFAVSVTLAAAAVALAVLFRLNRCFLLFLAVMFYPYALQLIPRNSSSGNLIGFPTPQHLMLLFLPALLLAVAAVLSAVLPRRSRLLPSPGQDKPRPT